MDGNFEHADGLWRSHSSGMKDGFAHFLDDGQDQISFINVRSEGHGSDA
jgi:hypothetical protein